MDFSEYSASEQLVVFSSGWLDVVGSKLPLSADSQEVGARAGSAVAEIVLASSVVVVKRAAVRFISVTEPSRVGQ